MLYDFIIIDKNEKIPLYRQIYSSVRNSIENGSLKKRTKLPSVRALSSDLNVSKTTVTAAYEQLCAEGYIKNKPQSGYYVEAEFNHLPKSFDEIATQKAETTLMYKYDFSGKSIDDSIINLTEWKKYVKEILNKNFLMTSYGEAQGEYALRKALQKYSLGTRSVNTSSKNIIVGAGTQPLLYLLCALLGKDKKVAMASSSFVQSEFVFKSFGYEVSYFENDESGVTIASLDKINPDIILINPNFTEITGENMPVTRRLELIKWADKNNALIIEDDYNGELRYSTLPMPCVQNYDTQNTVYLGSFSKVMLPSVRISYMVLPDKLIGKYTKIKELTNQTASKTEQLALAKYIENGKIDIHLRKARRIYLEKSKLILKLIKKYFSKETAVIFNETSLYVSVIPNFEFDRNKTDKILSENSVVLMPHKNNDNVLNLSFSGISSEKIPDGIRLIYDAVCSSKA